MKDIVPPPPSIVRNQFETVRQLFNQYVVPSYGRFELALERGAGSYVWDVNGRRYLDFGGGIAVCGLGHAHPEISEVIARQAHTLTHISNLYYHEHQGRLAQQLVGLLAPGKVFFCNSGAEANEGLYKLARKFGNDQGRFEILTALNSFHGRTLAGIAATGQDKVKKGFEPMVAGFRHVPYNDLQAVRDNLSSATVAILIEGIQGEGGVTPATPDYLLGLRTLCNEKNLLLLMDGVQCGQYRSGRFQSYQRILEEVAHAHGFIPDGISMAKALGNGYPIGAFWVRSPYADILGPGTHATTYGGTPLACAVAGKVLEIMARDRLGDNARTIGAFLHAEVNRLATAYPGVVRGARGLGLMLGLELAPADSIPSFKTSDKPSSIQMVNLLHEAGLLTVPAGTQVVRFLPPLNLSREEATEGIAKIEAVVRRLA